MGANCTNNMGVWPPDIVGSKSMELASCCQWGIFAANSTKQCCQESAKSITCRCSGTVARPVASTAAGLACVPCGVRCLSSHGLRCHSCPDRYPRSEGQVHGTSPSLIGQLLSQPTEQRD